LRVDSEEDGTLEALLGEDLADLRQRLLGTIFLVAGDEDDVLAFARTGASVVNDPQRIGFLVAGLEGGGEQSDEEGDGQAAFHGAGPVREGGTACDFTKARTRG